MKKISLIILCFSTLFSFSQNEMVTEIEKISLLLPDSIFDESEFYFPKEHRVLFWNQYKTNQYETFKTRNENPIGKLNLFFDNDSIFWDAYVNKKGNLLRIMNKNSDAIPTIGIKLFLKNQNYLGITKKHYDGYTVSSVQTIFYMLENNKLINVTEKIMNTFNFFTDNFNNTVINALNNFHLTDLQKNPLSQRLLFVFSETDTVSISYDFADYYFANNTNPPGLNDSCSCFDGEHYTKKYIFDNGKLRLVE